MNPAPPHRVFISYSRADQALVTPIVHVIRAVGISSFQDTDSIPYGKRWRPVIEDSIDAASLIIVFWCEHSRRSKEVYSEWQRALAAGKDLVPVLLDSTALEDGLADYQAVDLRGLVPRHSAEPDALSLQYPTGIENLPEEEKRVLKELLARLGPHGETIDADVAATAAAQVLSFIRPKTT